MRIGKMDRFFGTGSSVSALTYSIAYAVEKYQKSLSSFLEKLKNPKGE
jgi:hypothetical protein